MPSNANGHVLVTLALVGQLGIIMVVCILAGFLAGNFLDRRLGTAPVLTVVLLVAGIAGGMVAVYRLVVKSVEAGPDHKGPPEP